MSIDFTSTRHGIDSQSQRCAKLIAAIIAQALRDLTERPSNGEILCSRNENGDAIRSISFFRSQRFLNYADLVGFSGKEFLKRLRFGSAPQKNDDKSKELGSKPHAVPANYLSAIDMRTIRQRLIWADFRSNTNAKT